MKKSEHTRNTPRGKKASLAQQAAILKAGNPDMTMVEIGKEVGRCRETVGRLLKTDEAREILRACHSRIVEKAPRAVDNIMKAVDGFDAAYDEGNKVKAGISWEATKMITQIPGLSPSPQTSVVHQTFINQQANILDPGISDLIAKHLGTFKDSILIEATDGDNTSKV